MSQFYRLGLLLLVSGLLAACGSTASVQSNKRSEHVYAFGKPAAPASGVAPVVVQPAQRPQQAPRLNNIVYFDFDSYTVRSSDRAVIDAHAQWLRANPNNALTLQGHTDVRGGTEYNLSLGQKRAEAVRQSLLLLGIIPQRIEAISYGKERLASPGTDEAAHQRNRRVEFIYR